MKSTWVATTVGLALVVPLVTGDASTTVRQTGISGYSGNPATNAGMICSACHSGGLTPTVTMSGPLTIQKNTTRSYALKVSGGQQVAGGLDVSTTAGALVASDAGTQLLNSEVTHISPRNVDGNLEVDFTFDLTAPAVAGPLTLYGAGNSVNLNGFNTGDFPDNDTLSITVVDCLTQFSQYGTGTPGSGGFTPDLNGLDGDCNLGWSINLTNGLGKGGGFLWSSGSSATIPFACGDILVNIPFFFSFGVKLNGPAGVPGAGSLTLGGLDLTTFAGLDIYMQALMFDPGACKGVALSNGLLMDIG